jgi:TRAP-type C4-dicarboxylate transport system permease small subunit
VRRGLDLLALAAGWALLGLSVLVGFEVVVRKLFTFSVKGVDEIGGYVLAIGSAFGFIYALMQHAHIRVDIAFKFFPAALRAVLHLLAFATLTAFAGLLAWRSIAVWMRSISLDAIAPTPLGTPLIWPQGLWALGLALFALVAAAMTVDLVVTFARGGGAAVDQRFHADRLDEEFEAERADALRRAQVGEKR